MGLNLSNNMVDDQVNLTPEGICGHFALVKKR